MSAAPSPNGYLQRYGRVARCVHGRQHHLHRGERFGDGKLVRERLSARQHDVAGAPLPNLSGKGECEDTRCVCRTSPGSWMRSMSFASIYRSATESMISNSRGIVGPDVKAMGSRPAQHLSGPRGAQHDACADPRDARKIKKKKKKRTRHRAPHDSSTTN